MTARPMTPTTTMHRGARPVNTSLVADVSVQTVRQARRSRSRASQEARAKTALQDRIHRMKGHRRAARARPGLQPQILERLYAQPVLQVRQKINRRQGYQFQKYPRNIHFDLLCAFLIVLERNRPRAPGKYSVGTGNTGCTSCSAGTYNPSSGATSTDSCDDCPADTFSSEVRCSRCKRSSALMIWAR